MQKKLLVVFPQGKQIEYIKQTVDSQLEVFVVLQRNSDKYKPESFVTYINKDCTKEEIKKILSKSVNVLCCHEESLYWVKCKGQKGWKYSFDSILLNHLTKIEFKKYMKKNNINIINYELSKRSYLSFPLVAKPSIGFGSIGVKEIRNIKDLVEYEENFNNVLRKSQVEKYKVIYFSEENNSYILEQYISGEFYRIPFLVCDGVINQIFPVHGINKIYKENSDFHWTVFEYGEEEKKVANEVRSLLQSIIELYNAVNGAFVAEVMVSDGGEIFLMEFSPRQTSTRISKLIYYATGIDIEKAALDIFCGKRNFDISYDRCVKMIIRREKETDTNIEGYKRIANENEYSIFNDEINVQYYEKI